MARNIKADDERPTVPVSQVVRGNELFHRTLSVIGLHGAATMVLMAETLRAVGATPDTMAIDDLGIMLPEIERRLLQFMHYEDARQAMARLRHMLITWEG